MYDEIFKNINDKIIVTNSCIIINDYNIGDSAELEKVFSVFDPLTHKFNLLGLYHDNKHKRLYLPSGLDLWKIRSYFNTKYYKRINNHPFKPISNLKMKLIPRDEQQYEALKFTCGLEDYAENQLLSQISLNLNTGKGKTYVSIATIAYYQIKSIIIANSNTLLSQWQDNIVQYTNLQRKDILQISGSSTIHRIMSGHFNEAEIYLVTHSTLRSYAEQYGWDKIYNLFEKLGIGIKIYDECHTNFEAMLMIDFFTNVWKTYYVSATPMRSDWKENRIFQLSLKNVPGIDLFDEKNDPHTDYVAIKWNSKPTAKDISYCRNRYGLDRIKYIDYITHNENFYQMMVIIMDLVLKTKGKTLMYIGTNAGLLRVYQWIGTNYVQELGGDIGIFTSLLPQEEKIKQKSKRLILSTTKSAGLGEHIEGLKMTIVLAEPFKSPVIARQTLGRTRDKNTLYVELVDLGFLYLRKYYDFKLPIFNKYASDVSDTFINSYELARRVDNIEEKRNKGRENLISPIHFIDDRFDFENMSSVKEDDEDYEP